MTAATVHPRLAARRARKRHIRQTVVALTVALFIATWALIFGTLASGHDPALAAQKATAETTRKSTATSPYPSSSPTGASGGESSQIDPSGQVWDDGSGSSSSGSGTTSGSGSSGSSDSGASSSGSTGSSGSSAPSVSTHQS